MNTNLVMATGLAYSMVGAVLILLSHIALRHAVSPTAVVYPRMLAQRHARRQDHRFGFAALVCGGLLQLLAAQGFSAPLSLWQVPALAAVTVLVLYAIRRLVLSRRAIGRRRGDGVKNVKSLYDTQRVRRLREAALTQAAKLQARELALAPRDTGIIYLAQDWDRRWWSSKLGVSPDTLHAAVRQVGPMARDVERHLAARRP
jgi:hypothetical protein